MRTLVFLGLTGVFMLGMTGVAMAQQNAAPGQPRQIHVPRSIDQEPDHLTKDLELTPDQRKKIRPLLQEHHDRILVLVDKNLNPRGAPPKNCVGSGTLESYFRAFVRA